jgi:hypothetical protein
LKIWIAFLLVSFVLGARWSRAQRADRSLMLFGLSVLVVLALYSYRWA